MFSHTQKSHVLSSPGPLHMLFLLLQRLSMLPSSPHCASCMHACAQSCPTLCNTMDCSLPGSSVHGIFQAIILEWVAIFSYLPLTHIYSAFLAP